MEKEDLHLGLTTIIVILLLVGLLIEIGYLDIEYEPEEKYYETVDKWI